MDRAVRRGAVCVCTSVLEVRLELCECESDALLIAIEDGEKFTHEHVAKN